MGYDHNRARFENCLARAHRALFDAQTAAEALQDEGAVEDTHQLQREVLRVAEQSLKGKRRRRATLDASRA